MTPQMKLARAILILAYRASVPVGVGWLQERANTTATDEEIVQGASVKTLPDGITVEVSADYVLGRMVKIGYTVDANTDVDVRYGGQPRADYQSWVSRYLTFRDLSSAARALVAGWPL